MVKDSFFVTVDGVAYKAMESTQPRHCAKCEARGQCTPCGKMWNVCGKLNAGYLRKLRKTECIHNA